MGSIRDKVGMMRIDMFKWYDFGVCILCFLSVFCLGFEWCVVCLSVVGREGRRFSGECVRRCSFFCCCCRVRLPSFAVRDQS